jgi:hypothetical protein
VLMSALALETVLPRLGPAAPRPAMPMPAWARRA